MLSSRRRINRLNHLGEFLEAWDQPSHDANKRPEALHGTPFGNINSTGQVGNYFGAALTRWHPQFVDSVEAGVAELVWLVTERFGWITYTSCEGHRYPARRLKAVERHVGLLPRGDLEFQQIWTVMRTAASRSRRSRYVRFTVERRQLEGDIGARDVVDVFFRKGPIVSWRNYFASLECAYQDFVSQVRAIWSELPCPA